ncbi:MAG: hypothetical protein IPM54_25060 [Polyangiaceae bacterium]|nr:hypothetical protein [Polyangiaceae bacterium]
MSTGTLRTEDDREWTMLDGTIVFVLRGIWTVRATIDADEDDPLPVGPVTVVLAADNDGEPVELGGTILEVDATTFEGRATALIVGGKGLLAKALLTPRTYQQAPQEVPIASIVADAIEEVGELLDDDVAVATLFVPRWHRIGGVTGAQLLDRLADRYGFNWRMGDDGLVKLAVDEWLEADVEDAGLFLEGPEDAIDRTIAGSVARASIRPGTTIRGRRIEEAVYVLDEHGLRAVFRWGDGTGAGGLRGDLEAATRRAMPPRAYLGTHEVTIRRQHNTGELDVEADDANIGGLTSVPYYPGLVECRLAVSEGTRALLCFIGGDESKPAIVGFTRFEQNPAAIENDYAVARVNDTVSVGTLTFVATPDPQGGIGSITITYTPPTGPNQIAIVAPSTTTTINLTGVISTGSPKVFLRAGN